jgi:hypothetical protein
MSIDADLPLGRHVTTINAEGATLQDVAANLADAIAKAAVGSKDTVLVGPWLSIADDSQH